MNIGETPIAPFGFRNSRILSLPMYPELTAEHIERVAQQIGTFTPIPQLV